MEGDAMAHPGNTALRSPSRYRPPERYHVFVSYTTREDEVRVVKPMVDQFLAVLRPLIARTLGEHPVFYDGYTLYHPAGTRLMELELEQAIRFAIDESEILVAFVSPEYPGSRWCALEWNTMASKALRPWFDVCRRAPVPELRDPRPPGRRPGWLACLRARVLWRLWNARARPGGVIVPVVWKGSPEPPAVLDPAQARRPFDWRSCGAAFRVQLRIHEHLFRHGSVSPAWERDALLLEARCRRSMRAAAAEIVAILQERRLQYASIATRESR